jgi:energy-coupling factor transport system permease protein
VNVTPRYLGRGSWLARRDPRLLVIALALFVFSAIQVWDLRLLAPMAVVAFSYYASARIPWREVRLNWAYVAFFIGFIVFFNTILTGGELRGFREANLHIYFRLPLLNTPISAEMVSYALAQLLRFASMAAMGFPIAFAVAPGDIGPTFARLKVPYKFAYALDLTFRFVPSLAADMQTTMDAQRVRGYEWDRVRGGPLGRLRRVGPLLVPVTINAIVGAEDTIDAMDLRGFGTGRRTWLRELVYGRTDWAVLVGFVALLVTITILSQTGHTRLWVPDFLAQLAG